MLLLKLLKIGIQYINLKFMNEFESYIFSGNCVASCILCCAACIIGCIENMIKYINKWAYIYVGIYGYSFITAGKHVFEIFAKRGWTHIINDYLTDNVFWLATLTTSAATGYIGIISSYFYNYYYIVMST